MMQSCLIDMQFSGRVLTLSPARLQTQTQRTICQ